MSSIVKIGKSYAIAFFPSPAGVRQWLRLGKVTYRTAEEYQRRIDDILGSRAANYALSPATAAWLAGVDETIHARMVKAGLAKAKAPKHWQGGSPRLVTFLAIALRNKRADLKPGSRRLLRQTARRLRDHFTANPPIDALTPADAAAWRRSLQAEGLKEVTIRLHARNAKALLAVATKELEILPADPFRKLDSAALAGAKHYVSLADADKVLDELPGPDWRLLFGLARHAGLRVPSETHILTWDKMNWKTNAITVYAPKTGQTRTVPVFPKLLALLQAAYHAAPEKQSRLIPHSTNNMARTIQEAAARAGVKRWPKTFQSLRQSIETDWLDTFPQHEAADAIGHSITVQQKHYAMNKGGMLSAAAAAAPGGEAHQKAHQHSSTSRYREKQGAEANAPQGDATSTLGESSPKLASLVRMPGRAYESPALTAELQGLYDRFLALVQGVTVPSASLRKCDSRRVAGGCPRLTPLSSTKGAARDGDGARAWPDLEAGRPNEVSISCRIGASGSHVVVRPVRPPCEGGTGFDASRNQPQSGEEIGVRARSGRKRFQSQFNRPRMPRHGDGLRIDAPLPCGGLARCSAP